MRGSVHERQHMIAAPLPAMIRYFLLPVSSVGPKLALTLALLFVGILEVLAPTIIAEAFPGSNIAKLLVPSVQGIVIGAMLLAIIIFLRQDEFAAVVVVGTHLYLDWYLGLGVIAPIMALLLLFIFFLARSPRYSWAEPRALWIWFFLLLLALFPARYGALTLYDTLFYYPNIILGAFIIFWLGTVVARSSESLRHLFQFLAIFGALLASHTVIQGVTGIFLFESSRFNIFLAQVSNFQVITGAGVYRLGSFFVDPNWNGTFFATMLCIPLALFIDTDSLPRKVFYLAATFLILLALLFTFSASAWVAACAGVIALSLFAGNTRYRIIIPFFIIVAALVIVVFFPAQVDLLLQHATGKNEVSLRVGAWQTALQVIRAFPLTGVGLGLTAYELRAEPYRVPAQFIPLAHPHDAYLELAAMGGLQILVLWSALLLYNFWQASRNWLRSDVRTRSVLGGGIAAIVALSVNSVTINGWTLPPLAALGWLILGAISSPLLVKNSNDKVAQEKVAA